MEIEFGNCYRPAIVQTIDYFGKRVLVKFRYKGKDAKRGSCLVSREIEEGLYKELRLIQKGDVVWADITDEDRITSCEKLPFWKNFLNRNLHTSFV